MNQDKWTQQLHDKLAEREVAPPDDLWADIEAALPTSPEANQKPRARFIPLRRWAIAASLALLVAGGSYLWWPSPTPEEPQTTHGDKSRESLTAEQLTEPVPVSHPSSPIVARASLVKPTQPIEPTDPTEPINPINPIPTQESLADTPPSVNLSAENVIVKPDVSEPLLQIDEEIASLSSTSHKDISINLYASNGFTDLQHSNGVRMNETLAARYNFEESLPYSMARSRSDDPIYLVGYEERQKHHQPITFGLSVSYPLSSRLSLSTGVTYTRLRSDFTSIIRGSSISQEQTLHYLGVPLNAQYRLLHYGGLNIYLSGGAEADYNIKAHLASEGVTQYIDRDRWQFSVQGGVGLQYNVLPQLGLYAEPGVKHYFDNGSRLRNFFKDQPTSFNLQLGLRLNILQK
jgi:opacity protein-like surface antigen